VPDNPSPTFGDERNPSEVLVAKGSDELGFVLPAEGFGMDLGDGIGVCRLGWPYFDVPIAISAAIVCAIPNTRSPFFSIGDCPALLGKRVRMGSYSAPASPNSSPQTVATAPTMIRMSRITSTNANR